MPSALSVASGYFSLSPYRLYSRRGEFVSCCRRGSGQVAGHGMAGHVSPRCPLRTRALAGTGDVRVWVDVQVVVVDDRRAALGRPFDGRSVGERRGREGPRCWARRARAPVPARASVPTPMLSDSRLARLRNASVTVVAVRSARARSRRAAGCRVRASARSLRSASGTIGLVANSCSACADSARRVFSAVAAARLTAPTLKACPSCGATVRSALALGRSRRMNSAKLSRSAPREGASTSPVPAMPDHPDGRFDRRRNACPGREEGVEVAEQRGFCSATGARLRSRAVERDEQLVQPVCRRARGCAARAPRSSRAGAVRGSRSFSPSPRPARPSPKLFVLILIAVRVLAS